MPSHRWVLYCLQELVNSGSTRPWDVKISNRETRKCSYCSWPTAWASWSLESGLGCESESQDLSSSLVPSVRTSGTTGRHGQICISANFGVCTLIKFQADAHGQWRLRNIIIVPGLEVGSLVSSQWEVVLVLRRSLAVGVEKKFQVRMSRAGRSAVSNLAAFNLEIKMLRSFGYLIKVESLLRFPMVKDSSFSLPYFLFFKKKIIIYVSKFSCFVFFLFASLSQKIIKIQTNRKKTKTPPSPTIQKWTSCYIAAQAFYALLCKCHLYYLGLRNNEFYFLPISLNSECALNLFPYHKIFLYNF